MRGGAQEALGALISSALCSQAFSCCRVYVSPRWRALLGSLGAGLSQCPLPSRCCTRRRSGEPPGGLPGEDSGPAASRAGQTWCAHRCQCHVDVMPPSGTSPCLWGPLPALSVPATAGVGWAVAPGPTPPACLRATLGAPSSRTDFCGRWVGRQPSSGCEDLDPNTHLLYFYCTFTTLQSIPQKCCKIKPVAEPRGGARVTYLHNHQSKVRTAAAPSAAGERPRGCRAALRNGRRGHLRHSGARSLSTSPWFHQEPPGHRDGTVGRPAAGPPGRRGGRSLFQVRSRCEQTWWERPAPWALPPRVHLVAGLASVRVGVALCLCTYTPRINTK